MKKYVIAIDRGSTNVKAVLFDMEGMEIFVSSEACQKPVSPAAKWWEQDMEMVWEVTAQAVKGIFEKGIAKEDILGVTVTGQGNGLLAIDKYGKPVRMGILSLDSRGGSILEEWGMNGTQQKLVEVSHLPCSVGSPMVLLKWFKENEPDTYKRIDKVLFAKDWIKYKLCGNVTTDQTEASGASLMNLNTGTYAYKILEMMGLEDSIDKLPEIYPSHAVVGKVTQEAAAATGLAAGTDVICGVMDTAAFPYGIGMIDETQMVSATGTWGLNILPHKDISAAPAAFCHAVPDYYLVGLGDGNSGGCLDRMIDTLCKYERYQSLQLGKSVYEYIEEIVLQRGNSSIIFLPYLFGSLFDSNESGAFYGLKNWHEKEDILKAVYEGIVFGHYSYMQMIPGFDQVRTIWLIGGGAKSSVFGQLFADVTGINVKLAASEEITARGAALNALVGLGVYQNHREACIPPEIKAEYNPIEENQKFYQKKFSLFKELEVQSKGIASKISELTIQEV